MAYKQYTHCTSYTNFKAFDRSLWSFIMGVGGLSAMIAGIFIKALNPVSGFWFVLFGSGFLLATIIMTFEYLLGGKLICLGGDKLAIGRVITVEKPGTKDGIVDNIDNDLSINILLCPYEMEFKENVEENWKAVLKLKDIDFSKPTNFQDFLIQEQFASSGHSLPYTNYEEKSFEFKPNFHIELEGARIKNMYSAFLAAWALLVIAATTAASVASIPVIGWLLALLALLLGGLLALGVTAITYAASSDGSLDDVDPSIGVLHAGDLVIAYGTWTYDAGHNYDKNQGWNELHPVKFLSKGNKTTTVIKDMEGYVIEVEVKITNECIGADKAKEWQQKIEEALNMPDLRKEEGKNPLIGSSYHPLIDGCQP